MHEVIILIIMDLLFVRSVILQIALHNRQPRTCPAHFIIIIDQLQNGNPLACTTCPYALIHTPLLYYATMDKPLPYGPRMRTPKLICKIMDRRNTPLDCNLWYFLPHRSQVKSAHYVIILLSIVLYNFQRFTYFPVNVIILHYKKPQYM